jgi:branched-chain amino acid transport system permease protein
MNTITLGLKKWWVPGLLLVIFVLLAGLPRFAGLYTVVLVTSILMYIILTQSWVLFSGPTGYMSLATAAFFGVGIYTAAILGWKLPLPVVILIAALISSCLALVVGALTLRLRGVYFIIFTLGLVELIKNVVLWHAIKFSGARGRFVVLEDNNTIYYLMLFVLVVLLLTTYLIRRSKYGLAMQSIGQDEEAAAHAGVNVTMVKVTTFAISSAFMGAAGAIIATRWTYIDPYIAFKSLYSFMPVLMAIFGGMGLFYGPVLGAAVFAYLEEVLITKFPYHYMLLFGIILLITILYLPDGLVGLVQRLRRRGWARGQNANT